MKIKDRKWQRCIWGAGDRKPTGVGPSQKLWVLSELSAGSGGQLGAVVRGRYLAVCYCGPVSVSLQVHMLKLLGHGGVQRPWGLVPSLETEGFAPPTTESAGLLMGNY